MTVSSTIVVTAFAIAVTVGAYALSLAARRRYPSPLTTPVLFSTIVVIAVLLMAGVSFEDYRPAKEELLSSIAIKSTTVPIAVEIARIVHGNPTLTAIFVVITGMIGASFGPWLMDRLDITHPVSRGLALGTISHGQGTAQAASESELSGAVAAVAMGLGAICTSLAAPWLIPLFLG